MKPRKFTIIGGDLRNIELAESIVEDGNLVNIYGFKKAGFDVHISESDDLTLAIDESDVILGPLPCSNDNETLNTPFHDEAIFINDVFKIMNNVFKLLNKKQLFVAGRISEKIRHLAAIYSVYTIDLLEREEMAILNAIPTAEGAIQIAMEEMPITLHGSNALILGYGRIGKALSQKLAGLGANVYVEARKCHDIASIRSCSYKPVLLQKLAEYLPYMNVIINTIPSIILDETMLRLIDRECLIIDLASKPGGVDMAKAREFGNKAIWALSLPGKVAPVTAAKYIKETVYNIIDELGV